MQALRLGMVIAALIAAPMVRADVVTDWNAQAGQIVMDAKLPPPVANRAMAIVQTSVFEAVNAITQRYPDDRLHLKASPGTSVDAAVAAANHTALASLLPPEQKAAIDAAYDAALAKVDDGPARAEGIALGEKAALAIVAMCADDGAAVVETYRLAPSLAPTCRRSSPPSCNGRNAGPGC